MNVTQLNAIKFNQHIDTIDLEAAYATNFGLDLWLSNRSARIDQLYQYATGSEQVVAIVEVGRLRSAAGNPAEHHNQLLQTGQILGDDVSRDSSCADYDNHAIWVAGFVSAGDGNDPMKRSGAPAARVAVANTCLRSWEGDSLVQRYFASDNVTMAGLDQRTNPIHPFILNHSYGNDEAHLHWGGGGWMRSIDYRAKYLVQTEVVACGNNGNPTVSRPNGGPAACRSYNSINVGGYDDRLSISWSDDYYYQKYGGPFPLVVSTGSWVNSFEPTSDREVPELAAPAVLLASTEQTYGTAPTSSRTQVGPDDHTGTSFSAPLVSGMAAMIHEYSPTTKYFPNDVKALLLASSIHQINNDPIPDFGAAKVGGLYTGDKRVGVGAVTGKALADILDGSRGGFQRMQTVEPYWGPNQDGWRPLLLPTWPISPASGRLRVVLTWLAEATCRLCGSSNSPEAAAWFGERWYLPTDLDLVIMDDTGAIAAQSMSFDNNYEIVDFDTRNFTPPFHVYVRAYENTAIANEMISLAWFSYH